MKSHLGDVQMLRNANFWSNTASNTPTYLPPTFLNIKTNKININTIEKHDRHLDSRN
eukprot:Pgem_evm1s16371